MAKFVLMCVFLLFIASSASGRKHLHRGRIQALGAKLQDEMKSLASTIQNLKIDSDRDKVELFTMTNELSNRMHEAISVMTQAIPHIQKEQYRRKIGEPLLAFEEVLHDIQRSKYESVTKQQAMLVACLQKDAEILKKLLETVVEHHTDSEHFISEKLREASDVFNYAIHKIFFHATFFDKSNEELAKEIDARIAVFETTIDKLKGHDDEATKNELTYLVRYLTTIGEEAIAKLEYWMNLHSKNDAGFIVVKETANLISKLVDKLHHLIETEKPISETLEDFKQIHVNATKQIKQIADIELNNSPGDQEYIRGLLIMNLTVSASFATEIDFFLAKKTVNKFN